MAGIIIIQVFILMILFALGAFFSGVETALITLSRSKTKLLMAKYPKRAKALAVWLDNPNELLTTLLVGINAVAVASATLSAAMADTLSDHFGLNKLFLSFLSGLMVTVIIIVMGEITPKIYAIHNSEYVIYHTMIPLYYFNKMITPFTNFFTKMATFFIRVLGGKPMSMGPIITREELKSLIALGDSEGILKKDESDILHNVFKFSEKTVKEAMVPLDKMMCVNITEPVNNILKHAAEEGYTRMPAFKDTRENIVGVLHTKELLNLWVNKKLFVIMDLVHPPYFIVEDKKIAELLSEFKKGKVHMAIVKNKDNLVTGLITLEDVIEEIVGDINDEFDIKTN